MATIEDLDSEISDLHAQIATLHAHRANLASILLSQPHLAARLPPTAQRDKSSAAAARAIKKQSTRNLSNIYRACAGVTAYKVQDPDPNAINGGYILGVSIDVSLSGRFVETYHVLLNVTERDGSRVLRIHKHTIPPCIPLQALANKWLPVSSKDVDNVVDAEQDLVRFGRALRKELVSWHMRVNAVGALQKEAGVENMREKAQREGTGFGAVGQVLNAFVSDDEEDSSDVEEEEDSAGSKRILDIEADAAVRQVTVTWSDKRTAVLRVAKDGTIERVSCKTKDGSSDVVLEKKALGPIGELVRRLRV